MASRLRPLVDADIPGALHLSTQAGWNQLDADWRRLIALWPRHCFAISDQDRLVATGTLAVYDATRIGWVGMILVDESHRGRGLGGAMMDHLIGLADVQGIEYLGLDATDAGRPVYLKRGFVDQFELDRCAGETSRVTDAEATRRALESDWADIEALDRESAGVNRTPLLCELARQTGSSVRVALHGRAYGIARAGRRAGHIGPIVADDRQTANSIFDALCEDLAAEGVRDAIIDLPIDSALWTHAQSRGFSARRRLMRMSRPRAGAPLLRGSTTFAISGFETG